MSVRNRLLLMSFAWLGSLGFLPGAVLHYNNFNFALDGTELLLVDNAGNPVVDGFRRRRASSILVGNRGKGRSSREKPVIRSVLKRPGSRHRAGERPTIKRDGLFP